MPRLFLPLLLLFSLLGGTVKAQPRALQKLSPLLRAEYLTQYHARQQQKEQGVVPPLFVFVKGDSRRTEAYKATESVVLATIGDVDIVRLPARQLAALAQHEAIQRIEMGRRPQCTNAATSSLLHITSAHDGTLLPQAYTGKGVLIGVQDVGFDLTNPNFFSRDMSHYRIRALWDMLSSDTIGSTMPLGQEYCDSAALLAYGHSRDGLTEHHGSHTLGTAAGSGVSSEYCGVAYDSDICLVANIVDSNSDYLADDSLAALYSTPLTALGFKYIFDYAEKRGQPCVISFSEGAQQGFEDDDLLYFEVLEELVGEGRIIVAAAGNNNQHADYFCKPQGVERAGTFAQKYETQLYFLAQGDGDYTARLTIYGDEHTVIDLSAEELREYSDSIFSYTYLVDNTEYSLLTVAYPSCYDNTHTVIEVLLTGPTHIGYTSRQPVSIEARGTDSTVEVFSIIGEFVENAACDAELCAGEASHDVATPGAAPAVIAVGATAYSTGFTNLDGNAITYNYGEGGERANFSSVGPTVDGRQKPDVMAPGTNIISSTNSFAAEEMMETEAFRETLVDSYTYNGRTYYWRADTGTSMATPFVAGIIALWLEACPTLTPDDVRSILAATCTHPDASLTYPNNYYGYGQIDAQAGLMEILGIDGITDTPAAAPRDVRWTLTDGVLHLAFPYPLTQEGTLTVYNVAGQQLLRRTLPAGNTDYSLPLAALPSSSSHAVLLLALRTPSPSLSGTLLLSLP